MDRFLAIDAFVRVAEVRSFAEAARQMRVSRSVVTARIQQLEEFVGAPQFHRNTRSVRLSELGQTFLRDCIELVGRTNEVVDQMREVTTSPVGRLRVRAPACARRTVRGCASPRRMPCRCCWPGPRWPTVAR